MELSEKEKLILESYKTILDGMAAYFGKGYEFVLHSLETDDMKIIKILNGFHSGRDEDSIPEPVALEAMGKMRDNPEAYRENIYYTHSRKGVLLKCASFPILGEGGRAIGFICINMYTDSPITDFFGFLSPKEHMVEKETFGYDSRRLVQSSLEEAKTKVHQDSGIPAANKNKEIISILYRQGAFELKDAITLVAQGLSISRNTVYLHIRNLEKKN